MRRLVDHMITIHHRFDREDNLSRVQVSILYTMGIVVSVLAFFM